MVCMAVAPYAHLVCEQFAPFVHCTSADMLGYVLYEHVQHGH